MAKKNIPALKIETINGRGPLLYLSLIEYKRENYLCVIDNAKTSEITAYVLDFADQERIDMKHFLQAVTYWFYSKSERCPLSIELARMGLSAWASPLYRTFDASYVSRIVGRGFTFDSSAKTKVRRRRVVPLPEGVEVTFKKTGEKLKLGQILPDD